MNAQITNLVEQTVLDKMRIKEAFTALDISNTLKTNLYAIRHGDIAATVRDIYQSGAMAYYDYDRRRIDVVTDGGAKKTQAFLYLHDETRERDYDKRDQNSLPLVPADQARDLSDSVAASAMPILPRQTLKTARPRAMGKRRDGALAIPRALVQQLGWSEGMALILTNENGQLKIGPRSALTPGPSPKDGRGESRLHVWGGFRVRICKTKLQLGALTADTLSIEITTGDSLRLKTKGN